MEPMLIEAFKYNKWANLHLLGVCGALTENQLQLTAPGTYGTVAATWLHLLAAEQRYLKRLGVGEPGISERDEFPGIAALTEQAKRTGDQLIETAARITPDETIDSQRGDERYRIHKGVVVIQALHHGNDHRTHICTILGNHGIEYGDMDVWSYGEATGAITPIATA